MGRIDFQKEWTTGRVLNIGSEEDPVGFGDGAVHLDLDAWRLPNFVRGDAHALPFKTGAFPCVVMGDILEHLVNPAQALAEAWRVLAPSGRLVLTVFQEWRLGEQPGQHIADGIRVGTLDKLQAGEFADLGEYKSRHPGFKGLCVHSIPEEAVPHFTHINQFDEDWLKKLVAEACPGAVVRHWELAPECHWRNWLICLGKGGTGGFLCQLKQAVSAAHAG